MGAYDAIVLGVGGVGSAALFQLARRGARVLGIDRFPPGHDRGSSHGQTRLIRKAYFEHPDYVPLALRAYDHWQALERETGLTLYHPVGVLQVGPSGGDVLRGVRESARRHNLPIENLTAQETMARFKGFCMADDYEAVFEQAAGYLLVEPCVEAHARLAVAAGAELHTGEAIRGWRVDGSGVAVETDRATYTASRLIITVGAWAGSLLGDLPVALEVRRKPLYWFATRSEVYQSQRGCPAFFFELPEGAFYGVPQIDAAGVKVGMHSGGRVVDDPLHVDRDIDVDDLEQVAHFVSHFLPKAETRSTDHTVCMYTMTADEHFIVGRHPAHDQVAMAVGLSGHGFKFTGVLGQALADLVLDGQTELPIGFLAADRPALRPQA